MQIDILKDMKDAVEKAIANGETLSQFKKKSFADFIPERLERKTNYKRR